MSNTFQPTSLHQTVREHYAEHARQATSCCGPNDCDCGSLYPAELTVSLPADITNFTLGCGDAISRAALQPGETVVDLGSGGGLDCFLAARAVGETGRVLGVDMTPDMLARARASAERLGVRNVEFREGFIEHLPLADGAADVIISNCVINLSPDKPQVFREMYRALRPGGRLAISDVIVEGGLPEAVQKNADAWCDCAAGGLSSAEWRDGLAALGFTNTRVDPKGEFGGELVAGAQYSAIITARKPLG